MANIQMKEVAEIKKRWREKDGDKHCDHPFLLKEYNLGSSTGDYVCSQCGTAGWGPRWNKKQ
ncbi:hypothetical protein [Paenibacillus polymyxa]|uniref:Uncharacterized protein n=1 Tax=Paenibacillus polymyxa TaxID=1406 RepID=A0ABX2ZAD6_PAEPO|nr:hypothetical protein [Paenibacillus polymyxa]ODA08274.1 hypothetical protein A7312_27800 [Paenibacillus polymyxa]